ncbi:unnamed protein product [Brassica oleracea]
MKPLCLSLSSFLFSSLSLFYFTDLFFFLRSLLTSLSQTIHLTYIYLSRSPNLSVTHLQPSFSERRRRSNGGGATDSSLVKLCVGFTSSPPSNIY